MTTTTLREKDAWAALWVAVTALVMGTLVVLLALFPALAFQGVLRYVLLSSSAILHTWTATWLRQHAEGLLSARVLGYSNACMALVDLFVIVTLP